MTTGNHLTEPGNGLIGTLAKARLGQISPGVAVYVHR